MELQKKEPPKMPSEKLAPIGVLLLYVMIMALVFCPILLDGRGLLIVLPIIMGGIGVIIDKMIVKCPQLPFFILLAIILFIIMLLPTLLLKNIIGLFLSWCILVGFGFIGSLIED